jgi:hypothetical protein
VKNVGCVHVVHGAKKVVKQLEQMIFCKLYLRHGLKDLFDVCLHELKHEENVSNVTQVLGRYDVENLCSELVIGHLGKLSQDLHFSNDLLTIILIFENVVYKFDRHYSASLSLFSLDDLAVATHTNKLNELIVLVCVSPCG